MSEYPEHDKIRALGSDNHTAGEFLDWLRDEKEYSLCEWIDEERIELPGNHVDIIRAGYRPINTTTEKLLYEFFGIDPDKIEDEKLHMLETCRRALNEGP